MIDDEFLKYLKDWYPYLYDIEMRIREVKKRTGFGDISTNFTVRYGKVEIGDIGEFTKSLYRKNGNT